MKKYLIIICLIFLNSCESVNKSFEITTPKFTFDFHNTYKIKGVDFKARLDYIRKERETGEKDYDLLKKKVYTDVRTISLNLNVKNKTGENIEDAKLNTTLRFEYANDFKEFVFDSSIIQLETETMWFNNETKTVDLNYVFNFLNNYDENIFKHKPKKIIATVTIDAKNSVGFNIYETLFKDEISIDNFL